MNPFSSIAKLAVALAAFSPLVAFAGSGTPIPEPGTWALVALAGVIGVVVARNKRK